MSEFAVFVYNNVDEIEQVEKEGTFERYRSYLADGKLLHGKGRIGFYDEDGARLYGESGVYNYENLVKGEIILPHRCGWFC